MKMSDSEYYSNAFVNIPLNIISEEFKDSKEQTFALTTLVGRNKTATQRPTRMLDSLRLRIQN